MRFASSAVVLTPDFGICLRGNWKFKRVLTKPMYTYFYLLKIILAALWRLERSWEMSKGCTAIVHRTKTCSH